MYKRDLMWNVGALNTYTVRKHVWHGLRWCIQQAVERRAVTMYTSQALYAGHFIVKIKVGSYSKDWETDPI